MTTEEFKAWFRSLLAAETPAKIKADLARARALGEGGVAIFVPSAEIDLQGSTLDISTSTAYINCPDFVMWRFSDAGSRSLQKAVELVGGLSVGDLAADSCDLSLAA